MTRQRSTGSGRRILDFAVYTLIGIALVGGVMFFAIRNPYAKLPDVKWVGLIVTTAITFGYAIKGSKRYWEHWLYWAVVGALLAVHLLVYVALLRSVGHFALLWFAIISPIEWAGICLALEWIASKANWPKAERS
jgi:hypothetical protein